MDKEAVEHYAVVVYTTWMELEGIVLNKMSASKIPMIFLICEA